MSGERPWEGRRLHFVGVGGAGTSSASASMPGGRLPRDVIAPVVGLMLSVLVYDSTAELFSAL